MGEVDQPSLAGVPKSNEEPRRRLWGHSMDSSNEVDKPSGRPSSREYSAIGNHYYH